MSAEEVSGEDSKQKRLVFAICAAQCGAQIGAFAVPTLLPTFIERWSLSNTEAGWLAGIFYAGYTVCVPVLVSLTDRIDPRRIYLFCVSLTFLSMLAYATIVDGFWSALLCRLVHGIGWAGTYMPGLKALGDRFQGKEQSRPVAAHAAAVGISGAMSFLLSGLMESFFGWQAAMAMGAVGALIAFVLMAWLVEPKEPEKGEARALLDFRPVFRNRAAIAFSIGYLVHTWEMSALRGWTVTFLAEAGEGLRYALWLSPAVIATTMGFLGVWSSVLGNEAAIRFGRRRAVIIFMTASIVVSLCIGVTVSAGYPVAAVAILLYAVLIWGDSSTLTAGASTNAAPGQRGATLAVHSTLGYFGGFLGPLLMGIALDYGGGTGAFAWWLGYGHLAVVIAAGLLAFILISPREQRG